MTLNGRRGSNPRSDTSDQHFPKMAPGKVFAEGQVDSRASRNATPLQSSAELQG